MQQFTNAALHVTAISQTIYECLTNENVTIHNLLITNNSTSNSLINLVLIKNLESFNLIPSDFILKPKNTLEMKPINLIAGDKLEIRSDLNDQCDVVASILKEVRDF